MTSLWREIFWPSCVSRGGYKICLLSIKENSQRRTGDTGFCSRGDACEENNNRLAAETKSQCFAAVDSVQHRPWVISKQTACIVLRNELNLKNLYSLIVCITDIKTEHNVLNKAVYKRIFSPASPTWRSHSSAWGRFGLPKPQGYFSLRN